MVINHNGKSNGKVNINGREYLTVAYRLSEFRQKYPIESGWSLESECLHCDCEKVLFKATIKNPQGKVIATGHAEEKRDDSFINRTSALENAETSAIGRALASAGFIGSEFASADEIAIAITAQEEAKQEEPAEQPPCQALPEQKEPQSQANQNADNGQSQQSAEPMPNAHSQQSAEQAKGNGNKEQAQPSREKAEQWAREHLAEWIDQPCSFAKAQGRSWRELAENVGERILIKGKQSLPRAYLHVLENWEDCKVWARMKAKVVLEVVPSKNGNGVQSHYNHPVEIGA